MHVRLQSLRTERTFRISLVIALPCLLLCLFGMAMASSAESATVKPLPLLPVPRGASQEPEPVGWERAPAEADALVVEPRSPRAVTRYGTELGPALLPAPPP